MTVNSTTPKIHNFGNNIEVKVIPGLSKITDVSKVSVVTVKVFENNKKVYESEAWGREKWSVKVQTSGVIKTQKLASNFIVNTVLSSNNTGSIIIIKNGKEVYKPAASSNGKTVVQVEAYPNDVKMTEFF